MDSFQIRRAVERLRDGLFDPIAVSRLTVGQDQIEEVFSGALLALDRGKSSHLCVSGSYGRGKSHMLNYLRQSALSRGYAVSTVGLDVREVPFHQFPVVYRSVMEKLSLPGGTTFSLAWKTGNDREEIKLPDSMPHRFRMILTARLGTNGKPGTRKGSNKKHLAVRPKEYDDFLEKALLGYEIPTGLLKTVCKERAVEGYREHSFTCRGNDAYFETIQSIGKILRAIGYKGLVLFFDEAESIAQVRLSHRIKSYELLDRFFQTKGSVFPVFAFTDDFFHQVDQEPYDDGRGLFPKNYADAWREINLFRLQDFSSRDRELLQERLVDLYSQAYRVEIPSEVKQSLQSSIAKFDFQETRLQLKGLVHQLDLATQQTLLDARV